MVNITLARLKKLNTEDTESSEKSDLNGLSNAEALARLAFYGLNTIQEKHQSALLKFLSYFWGPIAWMIEIAAILSAIVHDTEDLIIILVGFLAGISGWQCH